MVVGIATGGITIALIVGLGILVFRGCYPRNFPTSSSHLAGQGGGRARQPRTAISARVRSMTAAMIVAAARGRLYPLLVAFFWPFSIHPIEVANLAWNARETHPCLRFIPEQSNWIWEIQMNKFQMFSLSLAAVLVGPVHAQGCSGGNDGGMDATGNQCSTLIEIAAFAAGSAIAPPTQITKMGSVWASASAALPAIRLVKTSSQDSAPTARAVPASGKLRAAAAVQRACEDRKDCGRIGSILLGRRGWRNGCQRR